MELTDKEKLIVAEFIYSHNSGTLIKSEGEAVIELFKNKGFNIFNVRLEEYSILNLIKRNIDSVEINSIMNDYLNGKLI